MNVGFPYGYEEFGWDGRTERYGENGAASIIVTHCPSNLDLEVWFQKVYRVLGIGFSGQRKPGITMTDRRLEKSPAL